MSKTLTDQERKELIELSRRDPAAALIELFRKTVNVERLIENAQSGGAASFQAFKEHVDELNSEYDE